jgi:CO dehydrogenase/acetyl-CoA synthase epsilon subunit
MKYIITDRQHLKIFNKITGYIEEMIDLDTSVIHKEEELGDEGIWLLMDIKDYDNILMIYFEDYWSDVTVEGLRERAKSPILVLENEYENHLNNMFGNLWHEPMKEFVKNNFGIEIKSVGF